MQYKQWHRSGLENLDHLYRLNLINSISGYKSANLIGTKSSDGLTNLAIFSSVIHLGSDPALMAFVLRPTTVERHSYDNIINTGYYTINHVPSHRTDMAHYSSAKFADGISEFDECEFTAEYIDDHWAPFVAESPVRMGMKFLEQMPIEINGTSLIIGSVELLHVKDDALDMDGALNLESAGSASISGLNSYYTSRRIAKYPYARPGQRSKNIL